MAETRWLYSCHASSLSVATMRSLSTVLCLSHLLSHILAQHVNFPFESIQLAEAETISYPAIRFASQDPDPPYNECRTIPGDDDWPSEEEWARFNETLGGALIKPRPLADVCYWGLGEYDQGKCEKIRKAWGNEFLQ